MFFEMRGAVFILSGGGGVFIIGMPFWMMREDPLFYRWINLGGVIAYLYRWGVMMAASSFFCLGKGILIFLLNG